MKSLLIALTLLASSPALACHRYSHWAYRTPQHCMERSHVGRSNDRSFYHGVRIWRLHHLVHSSVATPAQNVAHTPIDPRDPSAIAPADQDRLMKALVWKIITQEWREP